MVAPFWSIPLDLLASPKKQGGKQKAVNETVNFPRAFSPMAYVDYMGAALVPPEVAGKAHHYWSSVAAEAYPYHTGGGGDSHRTATATVPVVLRYGNPHSGHRLGVNSRDAVDDARRRVLRFLRAERDYGVVFTSGCTGALKLVADSFPFRAANRPHRTSSGGEGDYAPLPSGLRAAAATSYRCCLFVHHWASHNSLLGIREVVKQQHPPSASVVVSWPLPDDPCALASGGRGRVGTASTSSTTAASSSSEEDLLTIEVAARCVVAILSDVAKSGRALFSPSSAPMAPSDVPSCVSTATHPPPVSDTSSTSSLLGATPSSSSSPPPPCARVLLGLPLEDNFSGRRFAVGWLARRFRETVQQLWEALREGGRRDDAGGGGGDRSVRDESRWWLPTEPSWPVENAQLAAAVMGDVAFRCRARILQFVAALANDDGNDDDAVADDEGARQTLTTTTTSRDVVADRRDTTTTEEEEATAVHRSQCQRTGMRKHRQQAAAAMAIATYLRECAAAPEVTTVVDAAAACPTLPLWLDGSGIDFVAVSFYKVFGYPTGVGALLVRKCSSDALLGAKAYFGGGTVSAVAYSVDADDDDDACDEERRKEGKPPPHNRSVSSSSSIIAWPYVARRNIRDDGDDRYWSGSRYEDGTPNFLSLAHLTFGLCWAERVVRGGGSGVVASVSVTDSRRSSSDRSSPHPRRHSSATPILLCERLHQLQGDLARRLLALRHDTDDDEEVRPVVKLLRYPPFQCCQNRTEDGTRRPSMAVDWDEDDNDDNRQRSRCGSDAMDFAVFEDKNSMDAPPPPATSGERKRRKAAGGLAYYLQGPIVTFMVLDRDGRVVGHSLVEKLAIASGVALRTGCFCNPGACQHFLGLTNRDVRRNHEVEGHECWDDQDVIMCPTRRRRHGVRCSSPQTRRGEEGEEEEGEKAHGSRVGKGSHDDGDDDRNGGSDVELVPRPTGAVRCSLGHGSTEADVDAVVAFIANNFRYVAHGTPTARSVVGGDTNQRGASPVDGVFHRALGATCPAATEAPAALPSTTSSSALILGLTIFPIKGCFGIGAVSPILLGESSRPPSGGLPSVADLRQFFLRHECLHRPSRAATTPSRVAASASASRGIISSTTVWFDNGNQQRDDDNGAHEGHPSPPLPSHPQPSWPLTPSGLWLDREWMLVDEADQPWTPKRTDALSYLRVTVDLTLNALVISVASGDPQPPHDSMLADEGRRTLSPLHIAIMDDSDDDDHQQDEEEEGRSFGSSSSASPRPQVFRVLRCGDRSDGTMVEEGGGGNRRVSRIRAKTFRVDTLRRYPAEVDQWFEAALCFRPGSRRPNAEEDDGDGRRNHRGGGDGSPPPIPPLRTVHLVRKPPDGASAHHHIGSSSTSAACCGKGELKAAPTLLPGESSPPPPSASASSFSNTGAVLVVSAATHFAVLREMAHRSSAVPGIEGANLPKRDEGPSASIATCDSAAAVLESYRANLVLGNDSASTPRASSSTPSQNDLQLQLRPFFENGIREIRFINPRGGGGASWGVETTTTTASIHVVLSSVGACHRCEQLGVRRDGRRSHEPLSSIAKLARMRSTREPSVGVVRDPSVVSSSSHPSSSSLSSCPKPRKEGGVIFGQLFDVSRTSSETLPSPPPLAGGARGGASAAGQCPPSLPAIEASTESVGSGRGSDHATVSAPIISTEGIVTLIVTVGAAAGGVAVAARRVGWGSSIAVVGDWGRGLFRGVVATVAGIAAVGTVTCVCAAMLSRRRRIWYSGDFTRRGADGNRVPHHQHQPCHDEVRPVGDTPRHAPDRGSIGRGAPDYRASDAVKLDRPLVERTRRGVPWIQLVSLHEGVAVVVS